MIFCYSSTGNSQWVAQRLSAALDETLLSVNAIAKAGFNACDYELRHGERLIFVFPVHSWNVPSVVADFISRLSLEGSPRQVWAVVTCGDDCGYTNRALARLLRRKALVLDACFSVQMPNDYVLMRGFDVDPGVVADAKQLAAVKRVDAVIRRIASGDKSSPDYHAGSFPWIKSHLLHWFFSTFQCGSTPFYATDACVGCGVCAHVCPVNNIRINSQGSPLWRNHCTQCAACFHHCPKNAVQFGSITRGKKQYLNSHVKFDD